MPTPSPFTLIAAERRRLADLAGSWAPEQWDTPSLAAGWRVREVVAHLTMPLTVGKPGFALGLLRHRGNFDRFADRWAHDTARSTSPDELVAVLREHADSRFTPPGIGPEAPLTDVVVHGLDIRIPLGLPTSDLDPAALPIVLDFLATSNGKRVGVEPHAFDHVRLEATDLDWAHGTGTVLRAPAVDLVAHLCRARTLTRA